MQNYLRNNLTGAAYNFESAPMPGSMGGGQNATMPDYSQPIDIYGQKGYRIKGDPSGVLLADGRKVTLEQNPGLTEARQMQALNMESAQLHNKLLESQIRAAGQRETPSMQHVETPNGPMAFNPKTGQYSPIAMPGGVPMQSKEQVQRSQDANAVMELTDQAAPLLEQAPGSYAGAALNQLGRVVGLNTDASKAQASLDVLAGSLIAKMPKMSGPQSDKDVALYKAMAGNLNDPTLPTEAKQAAMKTLRLLNQKYATGYQGQAQPTQQPQRTGAMKPGTVEDGHMYLGGDPASPTSWKAVQ